ncbi:high osmolarity signaling protein SHO1-like [Sapajus apella]|uniref:High osmolarity signaling protein SHO1-like n=1 Tax=Sapajus apella TaxID=9515 RepID=A0A6J3G2N0_SAPAP|nr:high osmolarity signaling protein SHO1-like [Sapajus apella]
MSPGLSPPLFRSSFARRSAGGAIVREGGGALPRAGRGARRLGGCSSARHCGGPLGVLAPRSRGCPGWSRWNRAGATSGGAPPPPVGAVVGPGCGRAFSQRWRSSRDAARGPDSREAGQPRDAAEPGDSGDAAQSYGYEAKMQRPRTRLWSLTGLTANPSPPTD